MLSSYAAIRRACACSCATSAGLSESHSRSTRARARASSASLSIRIRVASIIGLRINLVVLGMASEEPDRQGSCAILDSRYQSVVVTLDFEDDPAGLKNTRFRVRRPHILRIAPVGGGHNIEPGVILRRPTLMPLCPAWSADVPMTILNRAWHEFPKIGGRVGPGDRAIGPPDVLRRKWRASSEYAIVANPVVFRDASR